MLLKERNHHLTLVSSNQKTGPIPVSTHPESSCPDSCALKGNGCYAGSGPLRLHWKKVSTGTQSNVLNWSEFCNQVKRFPTGQLWRYAQAGDLPGDNETIDDTALRQLTRANKNRNGFAYTHKPLTTGNLAAIREANQQGFTINLSANNTTQAASYVKEHKLPTVTILPIDAPNVQTIVGIKVVACPAETKNITCARCGLCAVADRNYVIGFRAHGTGKKKAEKIALMQVA